MSDLVFYIFCRYLVIVSFDIAADEYFLIELSNCLLTPDPPILLITSASSANCTHTHALALRVILFNQSSVEMVNSKLVTRKSKQNEIFQTEYHALTLILLTWFFAMIHERMP